MLNKTRKIYYPKKYYRGLTLRNKTIRKQEIKKYGSISWKNPDAYKGFKTDIGVKTKKSRYTGAWKSKFPNATSLEQKAEVSGVPLKFIKQSYNRGMAAWRTGHRPGATQQEWGYARTHSLLLKGKTFYTADSDIAKEAMATSASARLWFNKIKKFT
jgi:hypothetical protein